MLTSSDHYRHHEKKDVSVLGDAVEISMTEEIINNTGCTLIAFSPTSLLVRFVMVLRQLLKSNCYTYFSHKRSGVYSFKWSNALQETNVILAK